MENAIHVWTERLSMFCRTQTLVHRGSGVRIQTPLMVPSFSSKGFARSSRVQRNKKRKDGYRSLLHKTLVSTTEFITESFLISAFDIARGHLPPPGELERFPNLIFLDSGGYEISDYQDLSEIDEPVPVDKKWNVSDLKKIHDAWPHEIPAAFISFDHPKLRRPFKSQVEEARKLFHGQKQHFRTFLLKPESKSQTTLRDTLKSVLKNIKLLKYFDIVGVTEWEIGGNMLERMANIAKLRLAMDEMKLRHIPLHIFGALDPLSTVLYFMAGAEIFDGLTWLRYAYCDARCVYRHNQAALAFALETSDESARMQIIVRNYYYLKQLEQQLKDFAATGNFDKLRSFSGQLPPIDSNVTDFFRRAADSMKTKITSERRR